MSESASRRENLDAVDCSRIYSALDSMSSPTIMHDGQTNGAPGIGNESPLPVMPLWQFDDEGLFDAAIANTPEHKLLIPMSFDLNDLTMIEHKLDDPVDETTLESVMGQIRDTQQLLDLVREEICLTKQRAEQINSRWTCKGHLSTELLRQYPKHFETPAATWDEDIGNLITRLCVYQKDFRNVIILNLAYVYGLYTCLNVHPLTRTRTRTQAHPCAHAHSIRTCVDACVGNALVNVHSNARIHCKLLEHLHTNEL